MSFTRKPCVIGGQTSPDDWLILYKGRKIGRVMREPVKHEWVWALWTYPMHSDRTETLDETLEAIKTTVLSLPTPIQMAGKRPPII